MGSRKVFQSVEKMFVSPEKCDGGCIFFIFFFLKKLPNEFVSNSFDISLLLADSFTEAAGISFELCF